VMRKSLLGLTQADENAARGHEVSANTGKAAVAQRRSPRLAAAAAAVTTTGNGLGSLEKRSNSVSSSVDQTPSYTSSATLPNFDFSLNDQQHSFSKQQPQQAPQPQQELQSNPRIPENLSSKLGMSAPGSFDPLKVMPVGRRLSVLGSAIRTNDSSTSQRLSVGAPLATPSSSSLAVQQMAAMIPSLVGMPAVPGISSGLIVPSKGRSLRLANSAVLGGGAQRLL
jgi:hypothetical protein